MSGLVDDLRASLEQGQRAYRKARTTRWRADERERRARARGYPAPALLLDPSQPAARDLPHREQAAPIIAWRFARIVREHDGWRFASLNEPFGTFAVEDEALCKKRVKHRAPALDCTCGFYALRTKPALSARVHAREWLLEVELYGTVIAHEYGYRAQYQRVRSLLAGFCWCEEPASTVVATRVESRAPRLELYCAEHQPVATPLLGFARALGTGMRAYVAAVSP